MSRAFVKEESASEPVLIPPRAPLPEGTPNYVTPHGLELLKSELERLLAEQSRLQSGKADETEERREQALIRGRITALNDRITNARVVETAAGPQDQVRFGASVRLRRPDSGEEKRITIVGVDEANAGSGRVSFLAPVARALLGRELGEEIRLPGAGGEADWEIVEID